MADLLAGMVDGAWLDAQVFPELHWAVPGIMPEGFGLLIAPPKAGKSWLAASIGLTCQAGGLALGVIPVEARPVLYLALEDGHRRLQSRFRALGSANGIPPISIIVDAKTEQIVPMMEEFNTRHADESPLIILDVLGKVSPPGSYAGDYEIANQLLAVVSRAPGSTLLALHHTRKTPSADFLDSALGSRGVVGAADFLLALKRPRYSSHATLAITGRDVEEGEYALATANGIWRIDGESLPKAAQKACDDADLAALSERMADVLALVTGETRPADVAYAMEMDAKTAAVYLARLADDGRIVRVKRGVYFPVESVESVDIDRQG